MKIYSLCYKFILAVGLVLLLFIGGTSVVLHGHLDYVKERMLFYRNGVLFYVLLAVLAIGVWKLRDKIGSIPSGKVFFACSVLYALAGLYVAFRVPEALKDDPYMIYKYAQQFLNGDYKGLTEHYYLRYFPYQLGMVTFEMGLLSIWNSTRIFFIANLVLILGTNFFQWKATELLFENDKVTTWSVLLSFGFVPMLFYILFVYGSIPGYFFVAVGFYFFIRYLKKESVIYAAIGALCLGVSLIFKPNYIIAVMAAAIVLLLDLFKKISVKRVAIIALVVVLSILPNKVFTDMWRHISGINFDGGAPWILNVTMGLQPEGVGDGEELGGWYNAYNHDTFEATGFSVEESNRIAIEDMKALIAYWSGGEADTLRFFRDKIWSTWCDPLFQLTYVGPMEFSNQRVADRILHSLYDNDTLEMIIERYMNLMIVVIYLLSALWCGRKFLSKPADTEALLSLLLFIGGFLFHLISETKSQYVFMYVFGIIPYAASGMFSVKKTL